MKEHEYNPELPHGLPEDAYLQARDYGIADAWQEEMGIFDDYAVLPAGVLNGNGVNLLRTARSKGWDHHNFFHYKRLGISWLMLKGLNDLIAFTGINPIQNQADFTLPEITKQYVKPRTINPDIYQPINGHATGLLGTGKEISKIRTIWDSHETVDYDFSLFNWQRSGFPRRIPSFLSYKNISDEMFGRGSKVTKYEAPLDILEALGRSELHQVLEPEFFTDKLIQVFQDLLTTHGLFIGLWYEKYFEKRLIRSVASLRTRTSILVRLFNEAYGFTKTSNADSTIFTNIAGHVFWQMLFMSSQDDSARLRMQAWIEQFSETQRCLRCSTLFSPILTEPDHYFGSNGNINICFGCIEPKTPDVSDLDHLILKFVNSCGFPPPDGRTPTDWRVNTKLSHEEQINVIDAWCEMGGIHHVKNSLGISWFKAMYDSGCLPEGSMATTRGIKCIANDGHECSSLDEKTIDDFLNANQITHEKEPYYPGHTVLNPNTRLRADWKVESTLIEYFGLTGNSAYDEKTTRKLQLAAETGITLIPLFPEDVIDLKTTLIAPLTAGS